MTSEEPPTQHAKTREERMLQQRVIIDELYPGYKNYQDEQIDFCLGASSPDRYLILMPRACWAPWNPFPVWGYTRFKCITPPISLLIPFIQKKFSPHGIEDFGSHWHATRVDILNIRHNLRQYGVLANVLFTSVVLKCQPIHRYHVVICKCRVFVYSLMLIRISKHWMKSSSI